MSSTTPLETTADRMLDLSHALDAWAKRYNNGGDARSESLAMLHLGEAHSHIVAAIAALGRV
jgi:hypothetical protein